MSRNDKSILRAVQLIDENIHYIHANMKEWCQHLGITNVWKIEILKFEGPYLTMTYLDNLDNKVKTQVPLFDYAAWRRDHEKR